jgi:hypothetical protein
MKAWHLIAPAWAELDTIWRTPWPFLLWPVCEKPLLMYWLDEAVRRGVPSVSIEAVDRPHLVRQWLEGSALWSRSIEVQSQPGGGEGKELFAIEGLPDQKGLAPINTGKELMQRWYDLQVEALRRRSSGIIHLDHEFHPGVWFSPGVRTSKDATFIPPCWVGPRARIEGGCRVGPHAFVGADVFLDKDVEVVESIVCADTYVGPHITLNRMAAQGGLLMDFERGIGVEVLDEFVMTSMAPTSSFPSLQERVAAFILGPLLEWVARIVNRGEQRRETVFRIARSRIISLHSYARGPLCLQRAAWLRMVAAGKMKWYGVLPRTEEDWANLTPEARSVLEQAAVGVFALSDLYQCHSPKDPDEWMHALFQAGNPAGMNKRSALASIMKVAFSRSVINC